jgi:hypothetical protein
VSFLRLQIEAKFYSKIVSCSFYMNFYVYQLTQVRPPWPWPLENQNETSVVLLPMFHSVFIPIFRMMCQFLIILWIFTGILNIQYSRRDLDLWTWRRWTMLTLRSCNVLVLCQMTISCINCINYTLIIFKHENDKCASNSIFRGKGYVTSFFVG